MTRHKAFTTAAARRRQDPIVWTIDGHEIRLRATLNLAEIAPLVEALQDEGDGKNQIAAIAAKRDMLVDAVRAFVEPASHEAYEVVAADLDMGLLAEMVQDLIREYTGTGNPTEPSSSSDGSEQTGPSSTDGARAEDSTPST